MRIIVPAIMGLAALTASPALAQPEPAAPSQIISIYRAAPGHQEQLLQWLARQDEVSQAAGLPAAQLYVHQNGASWDYLIINPQTTDVQDEALDAVATRMNVPTGPRVGLELRQHVAEHTDTIVTGPISAADMLRRLGR